MVCETCPYYTLQNNISTEEFYCGKLGTKVLYVGPCEQEDIVMAKTYSNPSKLNRHDRNMKYKKKLKRIANLDQCYPSAVRIVGDYNYDTRQWDYIKYYKREYRANHAPGYSGFLKRLASKKARRYTGELKNGGAYKKTFDYWWSLY